MTDKKPKIACLIVAAGNGERMNTTIPKQYMPLHGISVLRRTVNKMIDCGFFDGVQCVISKTHGDLYQRAVDGFDLLPYVIGGATRQESVHNGLKALADIRPDYVLIHDAARPFVTAQDIHNVIHSVERYQAATLASPVSESLLKSSGETIPREDMYLVQTPQAFDYDIIVSAHNKAVHDGFMATDDAAIVRHYGHDVAIVECGRHNIKITTQADWELAEKLVGQTMEIRTGSGFDVHAFDDVPADTIRLCGVNIPYNRSLKGHSDADVGLHAITDAIFGALADGDIGSHFPPSDMNFKNMDSHVFLDKSVEILTARGGKIKHIDVTFMCESPKIGKHREEIVSHLSNHLKLSTGRISVKATTTEKLGFTGREEGIACQAIVTIEVPYED